MVCRDVKVTNCYFSIFSLLYKRFSLKKRRGGHHSMVTYVFSNFQVPKILEKKLWKKIWFCTLWNVSIWDGINKHSISKRFGKHSSETKKQAKIHDFFKILLFYKEKTYAASYSKGLLLFYTLVLWKIDSNLK